MNETVIGQIDKILFEDDGFFIGVLKSGEKISGTYYESEVSNLKHQNTLDVFDEISFYKHPSSIDITPLTELDDIEKPCQ